MSDSLWKELWTFQLAEMLDEAGLAGIVQQLDDRVGFQVGEDRARRPEHMQLINAQNARCLKTPGRIELVDVLVEDVANRARIKANFLRNGDKGSARGDRLALNVLHKPPGHVPPLIHIWKWLRARGAAVATQIALSLDLDHHLLALRRQIVKMLSIPAASHQCCAAAGS